MDTRSQPKNHSWVQTADGSWTLFSNHFQEACHSTSGAVAETLLHYVKGCHIEGKDPLNILEVGLGLGVGFLTTYEVLKDSSKKWTFLSLELDEDLLEWFRTTHHSHPFLKNLNWHYQNDVRFLKAENEYVTLTILSGDARKVLPVFMNTSSLRWNAIYQDAFSPKKNPSLWTKEWFTFLKEFSDQEVHLSTYSASNSIRKSLHEAGWKIFKGEKFGPKRTSTRARLIGETDPEIQLQLERSPTSALSDDKIVEFLQNS